MTISDIDEESHAICPLNSWTLCTVICSSFFTAVPQTPFPILILIQAILPWKGPSTNCQLISL